MDKIMYFCKKCDKLYKVGGSDRKVKCNSCGRDLIDLKVSDREYEALDYSEKNSLKYHARMTDTGQDETDADKVSTTTGSGEDASTVDSFWNNSLFEDKPADDNTDAEPKKMSSGSFFSMMPDSPSGEKSYEPVYAFDDKVKSTTESSVVPGRPDKNEYDDLADKKVNFFLIPIFSFVPTKYRQLVLEKGGKVFGALLVWLLSLISSRE